MVKKFAKHAPDQIVCKLEKPRGLEEGGERGAQVLTEGASQARHDATN